MNKVTFEPLEPVLGTLTEEYEAIQLLDEVDDLEDGELVSDIDAATYQGKQNPGTGQKRP